MDRYTLFLLMVQSACIVTDVRSGHAKTIEALQQVQDPNVKNKIETGVDETPAKKAKDYVDFVYGLGPKPFWFVLSDEGPAPK